MTKTIETMTYGGTELRIISESGNLGMRAYVESALESFTRFTGGIKHVPGLHWQNDAEGVTVLIGRENGIYNATVYAMTGGDFPRYSMDFEATA